MMGHDCGKFQDDWPCRFGINLRTKFDQKVVNTQEIFVRNQ